ncbi:NUDIX hydrolase [Cribrihabitans pelagius]|uniref:NUDIX hydrolase n=1 Tax=Cribrihabitans pelagius TaxID=1765746 RepID=UPI003B5CF595
MSAQGNAPAAVPAAAQRPVLGAIAVVCRRPSGDGGPEDGEVILVQRGKAPMAGWWGFPGGHVEAGETAMQAAARELHEETGVTARPLEYLTNIDVITRDAAGAVQSHYLLAAVLCDYASGTPRPQDDAVQAAWVPVATLEAPGFDLLDQVAAVARLAQARWRALMR